MSSETSESRDDFYSHALQRIQKLMLVLGVIALIALSAKFGWRIGFGFALGAAIAGFNFYWLKKVVAGLAESTSGVVSGRRVRQRFVLRYFLMAAVAFVILTVSRTSLYGLFAGLFLPVAAILCEAAYETYVALVRSG